MSGDLKDYIELKTDELKLRTTKGLSLALGRLTAILLTVGLLLIVLSLLVVVLITWLGQWLGSLPLACTIVCGVFLLLLVIVFCLRKRLFRDSFVKLFISVFYDDDEQE